MATVFVLTAFPLAGAKGRVEGWDEPPLVIVHSDNTPPLSYTGHDGSPKGLVIDFWRAWSVKTGVKVTFVLTDWPNSLKMMRDGRADVHGGLYWTGEREMFLDFTSPFFTQKASLFVRSSLGIDCVDDLGEHCVAVLEQGFSEYWLRRNHPELKCRAYKNSKEMARAALDNEVDGLLTEYATLVYQLGATGQYKDFTSLGTLYERPLSGAVSKGNAVLLSMVEQGMQSLSVEERDKVIERWIIPEDELPGWLWPAVAIGMVALAAGIAGVFVGGRHHR